MKPPHLSLWTATSPFSLTPPLSPEPLQSIQGSLSFLYSLPHLLDTNGRAHCAYKMACRPFACSGACYNALPHCSRRLPSTSGHLGPPPHASRCSSALAARQASVPLLLLLPAALARTRAGRPRAPMSGLTRAASLTPSRSLCSPLGIVDPHERPRLGAAPSRGP